MRADLVGFADAVLSAGCFAAGAFGWTVTLADERRMRGTTSGRTGIGHSGGAQGGGRHCAAAESGERAGKVRS